MTFMIDNVKVTGELPDFTHEEAARYVEYVRERVNEPLKEIRITASDDGKVDVSYVTQGASFERIRRITGYRATRLYMKSMHAA